MTYRFSSSLNPATGAEAIFQLKTLMTQVGWTVVSSSNGTTLQAGDLITSAAVLANSNAYFIIKQPAGAGARREFQFQRGTTNLNWKIAYVQSSGSNQGGSATVMPSASNDERKFVHGDQGNFTALFTTDASYRWHIMADDAAPFGFFGVSYPNGGGNPNGLTMFDPIMTGTSASQDVDPYVLYFAQSNPFTVDAGANASGITQVSTASIAIQGPKAWMAKTTVSQSWNGIGTPWMQFSTTVLISFYPGVNPWTTNDELFPVPWIRPSSAGSTSGFKGYSSLLVQKSVARTTGDTVSIATPTSREYIIVRDYALVWDGTVPQV